MLASYFTIKDGLTRITSIRESVKENSTDLLSPKQRALPILYDMALACEEVVFTMDRFEFVEYKRTILSAAEDLQQCETPTELKSNLNRVLNTVQLNQEEIIHQGLSSFSYSKRRAITSDTGMSDETVAGIARAIRETPRTLNVFEPNCFSGSHMAALKRSCASPVRAYGLCPSEGSADAVRANLDRVAIGGFLGSRMTNDAFDLLLLNSPVSWLLQTNIAGVFRRSEREILLDVFRYLRADGVFAYVIPHFKLIREVRVLLAKSLKDVQVRKASSMDFYGKGLVIIMGRCKKDKGQDENTYETLRQLHTVTNIPSVEELPFEPFAVPEGELEIPLFRGSILDTEEMRSICENDGCMAAFWKSQQVEKLSDAAKEPLLPFNIGQIGLVMASGCINGIIDEGDGNVHVIKGGVRKQVDVTRDYNNDGGIEVTETSSNVVEIHAILPNGEYKILA